MLAGECSWRRLVHAVKQLEFRVVVVTAPLVMLDEPADALVVASLACGQCSPAGVICQAMECHEPVWRSLYTCEQAVKPGDQAIKNNMSAAICNADIALATSLAYVV
jgi:hypothetical protein